MKVVLDTNVIVSAVLTVQGVCAQIFDVLTDGVFGIYADDRILAEYDSVLRQTSLAEGFLRNWNLDTGEVGRANRL